MREPLRLDMREGKADRNYADVTTRGELIDICRRLTRIWSFASPRSARAPFFRKPLAHLKRRADEDAVEVKKLSDAGYVPVWPEWRGSSGLVKGYMAGRSQHDSVASHSHRLGEIFLHGKASGGRDARLNIQTPISIRIV